MPDPSANPSAAAPETARERLSKGLVVADRYRIEDVIGEGGMGTVYAAEHLSLRKRVAIKVLHLDLLKLPNIAARFEREARATARIEHPNVASALDYGTLPSGALYLVLEYVEGRRLREELAAGPLPLVRALRIVRQIASLLETAQTLGIVHRDLKPENVLLVQRGDETDFVKVLDFGIARVTSGDDDENGNTALTKLGAVFGTPEYMAPEQALGQHVDSRADLFSLGVMLFEMLAGVRPYVQTAGTGILSQQIIGPQPTLAERAPGLVVPREVERLVSRLLAKGATERIQRASDVTATVDSLLATHETKPQASSRPPPNFDPLPAFELNTQVPGLAPLAEEVGAKVSPKAEAAQVSPKAGSQFSQWVKRTSERLASARVAFLSSLDRLIEQRLLSAESRLPSKARDSLRALSHQVVRWLVVGAALIVLLVPILLVAAAVRVVTRAPAASAQASAAPSVTAAPSAVVAPVDVPKPLALDENSKDPSVLLTLSEQRLASNRESDAMGFLMRALAKQPELRNDPRLAKILFRTADSELKDVADKSFSLLQGIMGAKGAELQALLWGDKSVREPTRKRAERWLKSEAFERIASGATYVTTKLRMADSCAKKRALLPTAAKIGSGLTLAYLQELKVRSGCGLDGTSDCYPCLREGNALEDAITQIQSRAAK